MERYAESHAKLILFGEHSVGYGFPAVGTPLPLRLIASLEPQITNYPEISVSEKQKSILLEIIQTIESELSVHSKTPVEDIHLYSDIPLGSGYGSSAALCTALVRLFSDKELPFSEQWRIAHKAEHHLHGRPSGVDTLLSLSDQVTMMSPQPNGWPPIVKKLGSLPSPLIAGTVPRDSSTYHLVSSIGDRMRSGDHAVTNAMSKLGEITSEVGTLLSTSEFTAEILAEYANAAHMILRSLGLSHPLIEDILTFARKQGALGGKMSGAGSGGAFYIVSKDRDSMMNILFALRNQFSHVPFLTLQ